MDIMSSEKRSQLMARIRGKDTTPERILLTLLAAGGLSFEQHCRDLPGRPDFVFRNETVAVFVDGDFWHGWRFPVWEHRMSDKWRKKISDTRRRDRLAHRRLRRMGWKVIRIWEHQIEEDRLTCIRRVIHSLGIETADWSRILDVESASPKLRRRNRLPRANPAL